jgi:hypothetical protein
MNSVNMVGLLTASSKVEGDFLFIVLDNQGEMPTLGFKGKQREAVEKWGEPKRMVSVSGALRTVINGNQKMTFVDVAYSRFLDSQGSCKGSSEGLCKGSCQGSCDGCSSRQRRALVDS